MLRFFLFKQKTAYEMLRSLVGSEMCIRDSGKASANGKPLSMGITPENYKFKSRGISTVGDRRTYVFQAVSYTHLTLPTILRVWICVAAPCSNHKTWSRRPASGFFCQAEDGIRDAQESRGLGDVYKRQIQGHIHGRRQTNIRIP